MTVFAPEFDGLALCSACTPTSFRDGRPNRGGGKWHNRFPRQIAIPELVLYMGTDNFKHLGPLGEAVTVMGVCPWPTQPENREPEPFEQWIGDLDTRFAEHVRAYPPTPYGRSEFETLLRQVHERQVAAWRQFRDFQAGLPESDEEED